MEKAEVKVGLRMVLLLTGRTVVKNSSPPRRVEHRTPSRKPSLELRNILFPFVGPRLESSALAHREVS